MTVEVLETDITTLAVDAIVNAANSALRGGGGVDGAIHRAAGPELLAACRQIGRCPAGQAVLTPGFRLPARFVIHAVGPVWEGGGRGEPELLRRTYHSAFDVARAEPSIRSIAFPAISTGAYGFPREQAARIALQVMRQRSAELDRVVAAVFSAADRDLYLATLAALG
ncbi:MAG TPA: O-acetyl-ADP-ribose deacetylase [Myxococcaceae bacterium]|nr:O-acetyl-ADP-ribose deacetylase [Myxococcaceae bacterium]